MLSHKIMIFILARPFYLVYLKNGIAMSNSRASDQLPKSLKLVSRIQVHRTSLSPPSSNGYQIQVRGSKVAGHRTD